MAKGIFNKFEYNSPVVLTFSIISVLVFVLDAVLPIHLTAILFTYSGSFSILGVLQLFLWPLGHGNLEHLIGNLTFLLLIGPMIEKR